MKNVPKSLRIKPVGKLEHLILDFLQFRFFWNSKNGEAIVLGNPRPLMPIFAIPYMFASEIYNRGGRRYFIKLGNQVVAVCTLSTKHDAIIIKSLAVTPEYRRLGIGLFILSKVESLCRRTKIEWLELTVLKGNTSAQRLYEKFGFTTTTDRKWSLVLRKRIQTQK